MGSNFYEPFAGEVRLDWQRFASMTAARAAYPRTACVYAQTDRDGRVLRVGSAGSGLGLVYRGAAGKAIDAAMHGSHNLVFAAATAGDVCEAVERTLVWIHRDLLLYNEDVPPPSLLVDIRHEGDAPAFG